MKPSRLQKRCDYESQLSELQKNLELAEATYKTDSLGADTVNYQREGIVEALIAVQNFLRAEGIEAHVRDPIRAIIGALGDADNGQENPILERRSSLSSSGRKPIRNEVAAFRGHAAAVVSLFMYSGMTLQEATTKVARTLSHQGFKFSNRDDQDQAKALLNFRKALMAGRGKNEAARAVYDNVWSCRRYGSDAGELMLKDLVEKVRKVSKPPEN